MTFCNPFLQFNFASMFAFDNSLGNYCRQAFFGDIWGNCGWSNSGNCTSPGFYPAQSYGRASIFNNGVNWQTQSFGAYTGGFDSFTYSGNSWGNNTSNCDWSNWSSGWWSMTSPSITSNSADKKSVKHVIDDYSSDKAEFRERMVDNARYYVGKVNSDAEGNRLFSNGRPPEPWCADFVTYITKKTLGSKFPSDFGTATRNGKNYYSCGVAGIMYWGDDNGCYYELPSSNKRDYIAKNIKPGDILIQKKTSGGVSHTGIVTKVYDDGSFDTVEGNASDAVRKREHHDDKFINNNVAGFVSVSKYA